MGNMPLNAVGMGVSAKVENVVGGEIICKKLMEMGFSKGALVQVVKNDSGALIVKVSGVKIVLARGMAQKVMTQQV